MNLPCDICTSRAMKAAIHGLGFSATTEEAGAINAVDGNGFTPLHRVLYLSPLLIAVHEVLFGSSRTKPVPEAVWSLVQWGADVNARDPSGFTPLHFTFVYNPSPFLDVVRLLLSSGADVNATTNLSGYAPLHFACALEDAKLVQMLLRAGADVNKASTDASGNTPLHFAMHADVSVVLIDMGANLHAKNKQGKTPLQTAKNASVEAVIAGAEWRQCLRRAWILRCLC